jgi:fermentation-respiration switch protein FrsA (DUF1100 family)
VQADNTAAIRMPSDLAKTTSRLAAALKIGSVLALPVGGTALLYFLQDRLVFNPTRTPAVSRPAGPDHRRRAVTLRMRDGTRVRGWWHRPERAHPGPAPAVLYFGGRSEEVSWLTEVSSSFAGAHVLAVNYRGYGTSEGRPSETALFSDALELYDWLVSQPGVNRHRVAVVGRSLGTGVAAYVASRRPVAAAALITPYDSIMEIARRRFPWSPVRLLLRHRFDSLGLASTTKTPVLVLMAERDTVVPHAHTLRLIDAWAGEKRVVRVPGSDHFDIVLNAHSWRAVRKFLRHWLGHVPATAQQKEVAT